MGYIKEEVWEGHKEKALVIRYVSVDNIGVWSGDMGMKREGIDIESGEEIFEMGARG